jgi:hypothetical protein
VLGFDLNEIRGQICPQQVKDQVETLGAGTYPVSVGKKTFKIKIKDNTVITLLD